MPLTKTVLSALFFVVCAATTAVAQQPSPSPSPQDKKSPDIYVSPDAPKDKTVDARGAEAMRKFEEAIKPYVEKARKTYPEAKERFLKGLPPRHTFFVTTRLYDENGSFEQVFVAVKEIKDGRIAGIIWTDIEMVKKYKKGDEYSFPESEIIDWLITNPDGTEEGNFVGKFLDTYNPDQN